MSSDSGRWQELVDRNLPSEQALKRNIDTRRRKGSVYRWLFISALGLALTMLLLLLLNIINGAFGYVALEYRNPPEELLQNRPLDDVSKEELVTILQENVSAGRFRNLNRQVPFEERTKEAVWQVILEDVARERVERSWPLTESLFNKAAIDAEMAEEHPNARLQFRSWLNWSFINTPMSSAASLAGVRTAILGSLWVIAITILIALPLGVGAAIYLEEYARGDRAFERLIRTNINNLAGVPSIIYGMLGLSIFVRLFGGLTSGQLFGINNDNSRTIFAAALTMALLILPLIIINAQEAIRAVPSTIRQASYGVGATKWQTIWHHVLPIALPGILTGNILAMSRAIGETAPLIVIGASTYIVVDPDGPFSRFTVLPIQIYNWTSQPQAEFKNIAAAAIIVLLVILLSLNSIAVFLRNRFRRSF